MISQTKAIIWIIVAVVVSSAIVAFSVNQQKVINWFDNLNKSNPENTGDAPPKKEYSLKEIINGIK